MSIFVLNGLWVVLYIKTVFGLFFAVFCKAIGHFFTGKILGLVYIKNGKMMPEISPSTSTHTSLIFFSLSNTIGGVGKHSHVNTTLLYIPYPIKIRKK